MLAALEQTFEVVGVAVEEALFLDEVEEHQAIEGDGGVPAALGVVGQPVQELFEGIQFGFEAVVEASGDALHIEGLADAQGDIGEGELLLFLEADGEVLEFLQQCFARLGGVVGVFASPLGHAKLAFDPLPDLAGRVGEDNQVFVSDFGDFALDQPARAVVGQVALRVRVAHEHDQPAFLGDGGQCVGYAVDFDFDLLAVVVPAEFFQKQCLELAGFEPLSGAFTVECHGRFAS